MDFTIINQLPPPYRLILRPRFKKWSAACKGRVFPFRFADFPVFSPNKNKRKAFSRKARTFDFIFDTKYILLGNEMKMPQTDKPRTARYDDVWMLHLATLFLSLLSFFTFMYLLKSSVNSDRIFSF